MKKPAHGAILDRYLKHQGVTLKQRCEDLGYNYMRVHRASTRENCTERALREVAACAGLTFGELAGLMDYETQEEPIQ